MDKKVKAFYAKTAVVFAVSAVVLGLIFQKGANHPPLRFSILPKSAFTRVSDMYKNQRHDSKLVMKKQGPFKWSNKDDLGSKKELGEWQKEDSPSAIVYYHRDKDAVEQYRAQKVLESIDEITDELYDFLGQKLDPDSLNDRKIPVYFAQDDAEYQKVMAKLSDGSVLPSNHDGCSFIEIGPLGCINRGIVLNCSTAFNTDENGEYAYMPILRRELARYTYINQNDFDQEGTQSEWFVTGLIEYFATGCSDSIYYSDDFIDYVKNDFPLTQKVVKNKYVTQAGISFVNFLDNFQDSISLGDMISFSRSHDVTDYFKEKGVNVEYFSAVWVTTLEQVAEVVSIEGDI